MPKITVTGADDFQQEVVFSSNLPNKIKGQVFRVLRAISLETKANIQRAIPVDTGAARARWGSSNAPGIWIADRERLTITQGAALEPYEYIIRLNQGSSQQAPAGFIDVEAEKAVDSFGDGAIEAFVHEWGSQEILYKANRKSGFLTGERIAPDAGTFK